MVTGECWKPSHSKVIKAIFHQLYMYDAAFLNVTSSVEIYINKSKPSAKFSSEFFGKFSAKWISDIANGCSPPQELEKACEAGATFLVIYIIYTLI